MEKNVGGIDKTVRIIVGIVIIVYGFVAQSWFGLIGIIPLATGLMGWCPLYCPLKINTTCTKECEKKEE